MSFQAQTERQGDVTVIRLVGMLTLGEASRQFRELAMSEIAQGHTKLVLVMEGVTYIDSSGLGTLFSSFITLRNTGGEMVMVGLTKKVRDLLQITKLNTIIDVYSTVEEAVQHLEEKQPPAQAPSHP